MDSAQNRLRVVFLLCALFFSLQVIPRWWGDSIVTDEEWYLTAAYDYWTHGDVWTPFGTSAPGALCGLPLLAMDLKPSLEANNTYTGRAYCFLYLDNGAKLLTLTAAARSVTWLISLALGFLLYRLARGAPLAEGTAILLLWAFEPTLLAYGGTAQNDLAVAFWFFLAVLLLNKAHGAHRVWPFALAGFTAGLAAAARYNGALILSVFGVMEILRWYIPSQNQGVAAPADGPLQRLKQEAALLGGLTLAVFLSFLPGAFFAPTHSNPFAFYVRYLSNFLHQQTQLTSLPLFFAGRFWENGTYLNFPYHFFYKTTLPFFFLLVLAAVLGLTRRIQIPRWIWIPPLVYLALFFLGLKSMVLRHALPAYPFLILIAAKAFAWLWEAAHRRWPGLAGAFPALLLALHAASVLDCFPHHLAYANDLMPEWKKPSSLYAFNWDVGQDVKRLAELGTKRGWGRVKLMTSQRIDPYFYGLPWDPWTWQDLSQPRAGKVYALDPAFVWDDPNYAKMFALECPWVGKIKPTGTVGGTWYYYEIPGNDSMEPQDNSLAINSFHFYPKGVPLYQTPTPGP
jgi:hypothetical protein